MSTEIDEERVAREKEYVAAMKNAKAAMTSVLSRNAALELALKSARDDLVSTKRFISGSAYRAPVNGRSVSVHDWIDERVSCATKIIGDAS